MREENRIDYVEIPATDLKKTRDFFSALFGWSFQEWGDEYMSFSDGRLDGGFRFSAEPAPSGGVLVVFQCFVANKLCDLCRQLAKALMTRINVTNDCKFMLHTWVID